MKISGKVCIVFGGAQGIGRAFCEALLKQGAKVILCDIQESVGTEITHELKQIHSENKILFKRTDVTNDADITAVFEFCVSSFGCHPDIVANTAGVIEEFNWKKCFDVNVGGTIRICEEALKVMSKDKGGKGGIIVVVSSVSGLCPYYWGPVYSASKHAIVGYIRSWGLKKNVDVTGVRMNTICPLTVDTPFLKNYVKPEKMLHVEEVMKYVAEITTDLLQPSYVADGLLELIEDDSLSGEVMRVTKAKGRDLFVFEEQPLQ